MTIRVALKHETHYQFDRPVNLSPHEIRLRPAPHCRTPIDAYSLKITPAKHFLNWQQDPYGNFVARTVFPERTRELKIVVDLIADLTVINPFDFFLESYAEKFPFQYTDTVRGELAPYLVCEAVGPRFEAWLKRFREDRLSEPRPVVDFLVDLNRCVQADVRYIVRMAPGVQAPDETLQSQSGSCRDSAWLLVQLLRRLGLAARFVSGYLIQLVADQKPIDGPSGPAKDFTDLHAWAEVYLPGAGWVGLDATSGLLAGEGHIPLAATAMPSSAAPVIGFTDVCESTFGFSMHVTRVHEDPRVTKPFTEDEWKRIDQLGEKVDTQLRAWDVRLTMGGEPTFVYSEDMEGVEWNFTALGDKKRELAESLNARLYDVFAVGGVLYHGQGKWYPGEPLPRWALGSLWRTDGAPLWKNPAWFARAGTEKTRTEDAKKFITTLAGLLGLHPDYIMPAYDDVWSVAQDEQRQPSNVDPLDLDLSDKSARTKLAALLSGELGKVRGYVLPLRRAQPRTDVKNPSKPDAVTQSHLPWRSSRWPLRREHLYLVAGDSALGYRLPLESLPFVDPREADEIAHLDPFEAVEPLPGSKQHRGEDVDARGHARPDDKPKPREIIRTALCVEVREGILHVFVPPLDRLEDFVELIARLEDTASRCNQRVRIEGYLPPGDARLKRLMVTPDPGVIEVNVHPSESWTELKGIVEKLYGAARETRLSAEKFMLDGRHTGTGGGNHVTLGGPSAADSPLLRRPDLLRSLIAYWQNHPALSYLFSGLFIGPTSQAPRVDEARDDALYELGIAFQEMARVAETGKESLQPWLVDRLLRNLLVDVSGNTHRAEFSIDKLYSPDGPTGRLGLLEFRAFEMPPHWQMSALQMLLLRALVARFWKTPYARPLIDWGTSLHDRFMLPHFVAHDMEDVVNDLVEAGYAFELKWFAPFFEFRFPRFGTVSYQGVEIELRQALEPWHVLGEEAAAGATTRYVDSSVERMQVRLRHFNHSRYALLCNGRPMPMAPTGTAGEYVAGVRYRAWQPPSALHPTIAVHTPLVFDLYDVWSGRSVGGCTYHVMHPGGRNYQRFPVNANEAEARRVARFQPIGHTSGPMPYQPEQPNPRFPMTLDLRRLPGLSLSAFKAPGQGHLPQQQ